MKKLACVARITRWLLIRGYGSMPCIAHRGKLPSSNHSTKPPTIITPRLLPVKSYHPSFQYPAFSAASAAYSVDRPSCKDPRVLLISNIDVTYDGRGDKWSIEDRTSLLAFLVALEAERATQETSQCTSESGSPLSLGSVGNPQSYTQETTPTQRNGKRRFYSYGSLFTVHSSYQGPQKVGG